MREIMILSRPEAIFYCEGCHARESVMISISDPFHGYPDAPLATRENKIRSLLALSFCDAEEPGPDVYGHPAEAGDLMQPEDARRIRALLERYPDCDVLIHCDAGISRSAGVAAAIVEAEGGDPRTVFDRPWYQPNLHCYRVTREAFGAGGSRQTGTELPEPEDPGR